MLRTSLSLTSQTAMNAIRRRNRLLTEAQRQISSGVRVAKPSDDPFSFAKASFFKRELTTLKTESSNMQHARGILNQSVSSLQEVTDIVVRAKQIAQQGTQITDETERNAFAIEVDNLINRLDQVANSQFHGRYIFGGTSNSEKPFSITDSQHQDGFPSVQYHGSESATQTIVSESILVDTHYSGESIFFRKDRGESIFLGPTGVTAGTGTNSGIGRERILVEHTETIFNGGSGITNGIDTDKDTIVGNNGLHTLRVVDQAGDGSAGVISLNGGTEVAFTSADDNLKVTGPHGEVIYVDTRNITANFNGQIDIQANGQISTDGGQSFTDIDFSNNQAVTSAETGKVTYINTEDVIAQGVSHVEFSGTSGAITALLELKEDILNGRNLNDQDLAEAFGRRIGDLDAINDQVLTFMGSMSVDLENMEFLGERNLEAQESFHTLTIEAEATDYAEVTIQMQESLNLLQFSYQSLSSIMGTSILNHI